MSEVIRTRDEVPIIGSFLPTVLNFPFEAGKVENGLHTWYGRVGGPLDKDARLAKTVVECERLRDFRFLCRTSSRGNL